MCGIAGLLSKHGAVEAFPAAIDRMTAALLHRGPDDGGVFSEGPMVLGHRRLAILDLSPAGHQPMVSADGRFVLVFNGEIYNFRELRARLDYPFKSRTDSEVLLAAWQQWGPACLHDLIGMYAFAVWDRHRERLHLVRDRLGIKPLYYFENSEILAFSSEVRSILASGLIPRRLDEGSLVDYLRYQCVHAPHTIVSGVRMLAPASHAVIENGRMAIKLYWSPVSGGAVDPMRAQDVRGRIRATLMKAVERRLVCDVPFGAFLSGGIDSSAIVALASRMQERLSTFSVSFSEEEFDETRYARRVADRFGTDHHEIRLSPEEFLELLPEALDRMDHPSGDGPNTYVVSRATRRAGITMALSGLGGDELFAGYPVFARLLRLSRYDALNAVPRWVRRIAGRAVPVLKTGIAGAKLGGILAAERISTVSAYPFSRQVFLDRQIRALLRSGALPENRVAQMARELEARPDFAALPMLSRISMLEMSTYMQNVLLRDTDQMSMAHALEVRVPFLDHELVELVLSVPDGDKTSTSPKRLLVESLEGLLPDEIVNRPKMGFTLPYERWMRQELREFCAARVCRLADRAPFRGETLRKYWKNFLGGDPSVSWSRLWMLVALEHWLGRNGIE